MANDRLRTALLAAGMMIEELAGKIGVHPKTAARWISNEERIPHASTRRAICSLLNVKETDIWPDLLSTGLVNPSDAELVHLYPSRSSIPGTNWEQLIMSTKVEMDVLVFSGAFLVEQYDLVPVMREKASAGVRFRLLVGDETAPTVQQRAVDEGTPRGLEGRIQLMRRYLADVRDLDGVDVRTHGTILYNSLYRFDDHLLVNGHAYGALAGQSPVLHLKRTNTAPMWHHYMRSFERVWEQATPEVTPGRRI